jgi:glyoxylase-like metal-dependent hydrolase (beta-lactamase superfamily II)
MLTLIEEIFPDLFRISVPLPRNPLKYLNAYVFKGSERNLVVDTGFNQKECLDAMRAGLDRLKLDLSRTDFLITHLHSDHCGLVPRLVSEQSTLYMNFIDPYGWDARIEYARISGFAEDELRMALKRHPGYRYAPDYLPAMTNVHDGHTIEVGRYRLECIETPGHANGHVCLYERTHRFLVCGDHILDDITPTIQCWENDSNPLRDYLASLDKVYGLDVELALPGHRRLLKDHKERIKALKRHHRLRAEEVLRILHEGPMHAFGIASQMTWDIDCESWDQFPVAQKWFATGEAISHLRYLEEEEKVVAGKEAGIITFSLNHDRVG